MLSNLELILRLGLAAFLGSFIGFERERLLWAAGLRTHMLVCVGSCLMMIISAFSFFDILGQPHVILDPSRIAAQVVSGIGFLGAGAILLRGEVIRGLTTAASLWAVAGIGLAVGGGLYVAAIATTVIILVILVGMKPLEERFTARKVKCILHFQTARGEMSPDIFKKIVGEHVGLLQQFIIQPSDSPNYDKVTIVLTRIHRNMIPELKEKLSRTPGITNLREGE